MKSFKMKALALATLGLGGLVMAGSAFAACTGTNNATPFAAWSSASGSPLGTTTSGALLGGTAVAGPGLNGTNCSMAASFATAPGSNGEEAVVFDNSPQLEQTYRFRFYFDPTAIASTLSTVNTVFAFQATSSSNHGTVSPTTKIVQIQLIGSGGVVSIRPFAACTTAGSGATQVGNNCHSTDVVLPTPYAGTGVRVEGQVIIGTTGTGVLNIWVGTNTGTPDAVINVDNAAWGGTGVDGVKQATLGLFRSTPFFRNAGVNQVVYFDEFDSRRQTAIGP